MSNSLEAKIVVLGSQGVGKTSLVHRYVKNNFAPSIHSTIGASFLTKRVVDIDSSTVVRLQIWDTAGQERFRSISKLYYRGMLYILLRDQPFSFANYFIMVTGANAALLCYDITSSQSFIEMGHWLLELRANLPEDTILHVVGTKADIVADDPTKRDVPFERVITYVAENLHPTSTTVLQEPRASSSTLPFMSGNSSKSAQNLLDGGSGGKKGGRDDVGPTSPHSNRSSMNFWGQDLGWDCCHEISASTGEGVEEVFRVISRRLVEQKNSRLALEQRLAEEFGAMTPGTEHGRFYGEYGSGPSRGMGNNGSFRVGIGDKRRSWMGLGQFPGANTAVEDETADGTVLRRRRKGCC